MICTLLRKPLSGTVVQNALEFGGGLNVDSSRVFVPSGALGRYPANLILNHFAGCYSAGTKEVKVIGCVGHQSHQGGSGMFAGKRVDHGGFTQGGLETVISWHCVAGCPVDALSAQSGIRPGMSGGGAGDNAKNGNELITPFNRKPAMPFIRSDSGTGSRFFKQVSP
jgi:hypothetical protein